MTALAIRTDSPLTHLAITTNEVVTSEMTWESGRELAKNLLSKIMELCRKSSIEIGEIEAVICYLGPGSFTGLRIGITVGNTISYSNSIPIIGSTGENWLREGLQRLTDGESDSLLTPIYGAVPNITL